MRHVFIVNDAPSICLTFNPACENLLQYRAGQSSAAFQLLMIAVLASARIS
jgi:hypothetical protein